MHYDSHPLTCYGLFLLTSIRRRGPSSAINNTEASPANCFSKHDVSLLASVMNGTQPFQLSIYAVIEWVCLRLRPDSAVLIASALRSNPFRSTSNISGSSMR